MSEPLAKKRPDETKKMRSRSPERSFKTSDNILMRPFVLVVLASMLAFAPGCVLLRHKKKSAPVLPPAAAIESEFRSRWIDHRAHELKTAKPATTDADARRQAAAEFAAQYPDLIIPATPGTR